MSYAFLIKAHIPVVSHGCGSHAYAHNLMRPLHGLIVLLRDLCESPESVDVSTRQKLFSTADIPSDIAARVSYEDGGETVRLRWINNVPDMPVDQQTTLQLDVLRRLIQSGDVRASTALPQRVPWTTTRFVQDVDDIDYEAYLSDDVVLLQALHHLHTHGLLFLTGVPDSGAAVVDIVERIGPLKNTFYGSTWDVRSVPEAKNVAYTAQDLGFHMDLMYMHQPPHLQFLHCIRSSASGGASLFTDSFRAAKELFVEDVQAFQTLCFEWVNFHYNHPESHYYYQPRHVIELQPLIFGDLKDSSGNLEALLERAQQSASADVAESTPPHLDIANWLQAIAWAPPFQAPFSYKQLLSNLSSTELGGQPSLLQRFNMHVERWHKAASTFNTLIQKHEGIYERMMKPGECVIFDNRRVLHARRAFEVGDAGKERWLKGAYLDWDPYMSKLKVLQRRVTGAS
ncbi:hypothetical protein BAUCODRAFT_141887 [Baudoinia panamericana UAMH 10762]|uniref:TauD/TfdA-like domain-containing protein n=1 Tax=Baudoinia panamericana (strain UAMH 10762) TaxID=717646 RepID=M2MA95_BAUPA|nr:uncharacterized protein BAUCODRAFT_141887 [Baudoinia panamericana UAMH 10762]EMC93396.1 hypothetical protein BAUCODRAFT_141887 [Baudoinia panamericana UAMH 10762]